MSIWKEFVYRRQLKKAREMFKRGLFAYRYNGRVIAFDPLVVYKKLREVGYENVQKTMEKALDEKDEGGLDKFFEVMYQTFGVRRIDQSGKGMTVREMSDMLVSYFRWLAAIKKNITSTPESAPVTVSSQSSARVESGIRPEAETSVDTASSSSDSEKTTSPQAPQQDSTPSSEPEAPSTD